MYSIRLKIVQMDQMNCQNCVKKKMNLIHPLTSKFRTNIYFKIDHIFINRPILNPYVGQ